MITTALTLNRCLLLLRLHLPGGSQRIHLLTYEPEHPQRYLAAQLDSGEPDQIDISYGDKGFVTPEAYTPTERLLRTWTLDEASASIVLPDVDPQYRGGKNAYLLPAGSFTYAAEVPATGWQAALKPELLAPVAQTARQIHAGVHTDAGHVILKGVLLTDSTYGRSTRMFLPDANLTPADLEALNGTWNRIEMLDAPLPVAGSERYERTVMTTATNTTSAIRDTRTGLLYRSVKVMASDDRNPARPVLIGANTAPHVEPDSQALTTRIAPHQDPPKRTRLLLGDPVRPALYGETHLPSGASLRVRDGTPYTEGMYHTSHPDVIIASDSAHGRGAPAIIHASTRAGYLLIPLLENRYMGTVMATDITGAVLANLLDEPLDFGTLRPATPDELDTWTAELRRAGRGHRTARALRGLDGSVLETSVRMHPQLPDVLLITAQGETHASTVTYRDGLFRASLYVRTGGQTKQATLHTLDPKLETWFSEYVQIQSSRWMFVNAPLEGTVTPEQLSILEAKHAGRHDAAVTVHPRGVHTADVTVGADRAVIACRPPMMNFTGGQRTLRVTTVDERQQPGPDRYIPLRAGSGGEDVMDESALLTLRSGNGTLYVRGLPSRIPQEDLAPFDLTQPLTAAFPAPPPADSLHLALAWLGSNEAVIWTVRPSDRSVRTVELPDGTALRFAWEKRPELRAYGHVRLAAQGAAPDATLTWTPGDRDGTMLTVTPPAPLALDAATQAWLERHWEQSPDARRVIRDYLASVAGQQSVT